jgi:hypothetical protein
MNTINRKLRRQRDRALKELAYCETCGQPLSVAIEEIVKYDPSTGEVIAIALYAACDRCKRVYFRAAPSWTNHELSGRMDFSIYTDDGAIRCSVWHVGHRVDFAADEKGWIMDGFNLWKFYCGLWSDSPVAFGKPITGAQLQKLRYIIGRVLARQEILRLDQNE